MKKDNFNSKMKFSINFENVTERPMSWDMLFQTNLDINSDLCCSTSSNSNYSTRRYMKSEVKNLSNEFFKFYIGSGTILYLASKCYDGSIRAGLLK